MVEIRDAMDKSQKQVKIYTDGGCDPNPGPGGYGVVLISGGDREEIFGGFRLTTNNRMEIYAAIKGLEAIKEPSKVILYSDSEYLVNAMNQGWATRWKANRWKRNKREKALNVDLWKRLLELCEIHEVRFEWVKGHAGLKGNERADWLSLAGMRGKDLAIDEGYEVTLTSQQTSFNI
jgi:ribonuclease HI